MHFLPYHHTFFSSIKEDLSFLLKDFISLPQNEIYFLLEQPKKENHGHLALPLFKFSKELKKNPALLAQDFASRVTEQNFSQIQKAEAFSGFVNFTFNENFLRVHLEKLINKKQLAQFSLKKPPHWVIDFASPNVAKYMNVGHLRATVVGQALVNLALAFGCRVTSLNHLGDWGTQFGKLLWAYQKWSVEYDFNKKPLESLVSLYVRFHEEAKTHPERNKEAAFLFQKMESGDKGLKSLWKKFVQISIEEYEKQWKLLNVKHEKVIGESFYISFFDDLKKRLNQKNLLQESDGALVVFLDGDSPPCLIQKTDGASTYAARDLCSAIYRFEKLKADRNIYVTGSDQKLHFKQIFETLKKMGIKSDETCKHISFGMYRFKDQGKMSSRGGKVVYLQSLLTQVQDRVYEIIKDRDLENKDQVAKDVGIGALVFNDLMNDCVKDVDFDWNHLLDFEGRTGPFVQYTYVRCMSLLKKYEKKPQKIFKKEDSCSKEEEKVILKLLSFEESSFHAFSNFKPHILACYLLDLSKEFNRFYSKKKILGTKEEDNLMILVQSASNVLKRGLEILNVPIPTKM